MLRRVLCSGSPLAPEVAKRFEVLFPNVEISQGYGSTEAGSISMLIGPEERCRLRSVGNWLTKLRLRSWTLLLTRPCQLANKASYMLGDPLSCSIAPVELEQIILSLPDIVEAAVVPYPNAVDSPIPMAFVVRRLGSKISEEDIIEFVAKQVAQYKKIQKVAFIDAIPKTPAGKILRRELASLAVGASFPNCE